MAFERKEGIGGLRIRTVDLPEGGKAVDMCIEGKGQSVGTLLSSEQAMSIGMALVKAAHLAAQTTQTPTVMH